MAAPIDSLFAKAGWTAGLSAITASTAGLAWSGIPTWSEKTRTASANVFELGRAEIAARDVERA
jgi:hypothetical protein